MLAVAPGEHVSAAKVDPGLAATLSRQGEARVIVDVRTEAAARDVATGGFRVTSRWHTVAGVAGVATRDAVAALAANPSVVRVGLDLPGHGTGVPELALIHADAAHAQGLTGSGVEVAVLGSGVDGSHPDLRGSLVAEHCFGTSVCRGGARELSGPSSAADDNGHGTNVAGIVTSDGTVAPLGVAPGAGLVAVKVLDAQNRFASTSDIVSALDWIATARRDVRVVNMSLGTDRLYPGSCDAADASTRALASVVASPIEVAAALDGLRGRTAAVAVAPRTLRFGRVRIGRSRTLRVTVRSVGAVRLAVAAGRPPAGFGIRPARLQLAPGATAALLVSFRPREAKPFSGRLVLVTNAPTAGRVVLQLRGAGVRR